MQTKTIGIYLEYRFNLNVQLWHTNSNYEVDGRIEMHERMLRINVGVILNVIVTMKMCPTGLLFNAHVNPSAGRIYEGGKNRGSEHVLEYRESPNGLLPTSS